MTYEDFIKEAGDWQEKILDGLGHFVMRLMVQ